MSTRAPKRRRASSPGPQKSGPKRLPSVGDSQLDADGETDPDVVEVEDELMQVSAEDAEEHTTGSRYSATASGIRNGSGDITFDDLEHFYSGNPIDIDQNTDEQMAVQKPETRTRPQSPSPATSLPHDDVPASPTISSYDPLFDSPSRSSDKPLEIAGDSVLPHHRVRAAKPLVKLVHATTLESTGKQSRITAKARLMSLHATDAPPTGGSSGNIAKRGKPGPGRSSSGLITKNRSSLLTVTKGALKSVKGKFVSTLEHDQADEIEEAPDTGSATEGDKLIDTSWSDEDAVVDQGQTTLDSRSGPPPSGDELLQLAGLETDPEPLPDYEDEPAAQPQELGAMRTSGIASAPADGPPNQSSIKIVEELKETDHAADTSPSIPEMEQRASAPVISSPSAVSVAAALVDEAVKKK